MSEYPNLFEKKCDESKRLNELKGALEGIRTARDNYTRSYLPVAKQKDEKLEEAQSLVQEVINRERGHIATRLASKYTRNRDYKEHSIEEPGVIESFEEWQPN